MKRLSPFVLMAALGFASAAGFADDAAKPAQGKNAGGRAEVANLKTLSLPLAEGVALKLVLVPAGRFLMGSPESLRGPDDRDPQHTVVIPQPFYVGVYEITQEQYQAVMGSNPSKFRGATRPVERISWYDAVEFCRKASEKTGLQLRLPTEAEWEYACRAGSTTNFYYGDDDSALRYYAWFGENSECMTHPVGQKLPNDWGLYDAHGNVWEWCGGQSAIPAASGAALRGGSFLTFPQPCIPGFRIVPDDPAYRLSYVGFRVVSSAS